MRRLLKTTDRRKPGRPATGRDPLTALRLPPAMLGTIDTWAAKHGTSRSGAMRRLIELGLKAKGGKQ
jgi:hypothetical protein